jgi:hypothetical protein
VNFASFFGRSDAVFSVTTDSGAFEADTELATTYAVWSEVTPIPLPAGAPLILTGFAALAALRWRKRRENRRAQV